MIHPVFNEALAMVAPGGLKMAYGVDQFPEPPEYRTRYPGVNGEVEEEDEGEEPENEDDSD